MTHKAQIFELKSLIVDGKLSMNRIEWWLLKNTELYKKTNKDVNSQYLFTDNNGINVLLPPFGKSTIEEKYIELYSSLDTLSQFKRNEKYFEQEMLEFHNIKNSISDIKKWVGKNEELGANKYVCFLIDYLDYDENDNEEHLNIFLPQSKELKIFVERQDFKNTIEFLEIFNELYWVQRILPESLDKMNKATAE